MQLSIDKCCFMKFSLKRSNAILYDYNINDTELSCVTEMKDLGVYFKPNLNLSYHISKIVSKSYQMLDFIKRTSHGFTDKRTYSVLYNSLIRSRLDYCSQVWSPSGTTMITKIERVQRNI